MKAENDLEEVQDEVALAEDREEGIVGTPNEAIPDSKVESEDEGADLEEVVPASRTIKLRVNGGKKTPRQARNAKRKPSLDPNAEEDESPTRTRKKGRSGKVERAAPAPATRTLRSRAPKSEEKQQADRAARARIRAALSEDAETLDD